MNELPAPALSLQSISSAKSSSLLSGTPREGKESEGRDAQNAANVSAIPTLSSLSSQAFSLQSRSSYHTNRFDDSRQLVWQARMIIWSVGDRSDQHCVLFRYRV